MIVQIISYRGSKLVYYRVSFAAKRVIISTQQSLPGEVENFVLQSEVIFHYVRGLISMFTGKNAYFINDFLPIIPTPFVSLGFILVI